MSLPELFHFVSGPSRNEKGCHADVRSFGGAVVAVFVAALPVVIGLANGRPGHLLLLLLQLELGGLGLTLGLRVCTLDDGQCQIEQEKRANKDHGDEEEYGERMVGLLVHDHDLGPALQRNALENV